MSNQWPEFDELPKTKTIRSILLEEGSGISERTNHGIQFLVESEASGKGGFVHRCLLNVPKVGYRYPLLRSRPTQPRLPCHSGSGHLAPRSRRWR